jgi:hypothetical protein
MQPVLDKAAVANANLCTYPNPNNTLIVYSDASLKYAMGEMLAQQLNGLKKTSVVSCKNSMTLNSSTP